MIAFTADNHIGITSQWSIKERGNDFMRAFHDMVSSIKVHAKSNQNKDGVALLIGGDLFDTPYPPSFAVEFVQYEVSRLTKDGCSVFGIDGNHDIAEGRWLTVCGIGQLSENPVDVCGRKVCGLSYRRSADILSKIKLMADMGVKCDILVLHLALGELNRMGAASDIAASEIMTQLKAIGVKLVLIGHIHIRQSVTIDGITFAYCGSTEMCSMNEPKEKSFEIIDENNLAIDKCPVATRRIESFVISTEEEFAKFESEVDRDMDSLKSVFVTQNIKDGVKRLRNLAEEHGHMMRVQVMRTESEEEEHKIDRTTGVIGLEQAIGLSFSQDSDEAGLIRAILRAPAAMKVTVDEFMGGGNDA